MDRIKSVSRTLGVIFKLAFYLSPVVPFAWVWYLNHVWQLEGHGPIPFTSQVFIVGTSFIPISVVMYGLYQMIRLFKNYQKGDIFSLENVLRYRHLAYSLIAWVFANILQGALNSFWTAIHSAAGNHMMTVKFSMSDLNTLIISAVILLIAWIMAEGHKLVEEQAGTI